MKCVLPAGCHNPDRCGSNGACYWQAVADVHEARKQIERQLTMFSLTDDQKKFLLSLISDYQAGCPHYDDTQKVMVGEIMAALNAGDFHYGSEAKATE